MDTMARDAVVVSAVVGSLARKCWDGDRYDSSCGCDNAIAATGDVAAEATTPDAAAKHQSNLSCRDNDHFEMDVVTAKQTILYHCDDDGRCHCCCDDLR